MSENLVDVTVSDGKYRIYQEPSGQVWADRYDDKQWLDVTMAQGGNIILAMAQRIEELECQLAFKSKVQCKNDR